MEQSSNHTEPEAIKQFEQARFNEQLDEEHEVIWRNLVEQVQESEEKPEATFIPLWADPEMPTAFRDRAMLYLIGNDDKLRNGKRYPASMWGYGYVSFEPFSQLKAAVEFDTALFGKWFTELVDHEIESGNHVLMDSKRFEWALKLFEEKRISEETLDATLEKYDWSKIIGYNHGYFTRGKFDADDTSYLPDYRFYVVHDLLSERFGPTRRGPTFLWAVNKLHQWTAAQTDDSVQLPEWLKEAGKWRPRDLYVELCNELGTKRNGAPRWSDIAPGIHYYGWSIFESRGRRSGGRMDLLLDRIDNSEDQIAFVRYVFAANAANKLLGRDPYASFSLDIGFLIKAKDIIPSSDKEIHEEIDTALQQINDQEKAREVYKKESEHNRRQEERERHKKEQRKQEKQAKAAHNVTELLAKIRNSADD